MSLNRKNPKSGKDLLGSWVSLVDTNPVVQRREIPFLDEYIETNHPKLPILSEVQEVIFVKSGKGYLIVTELFSVFVWKRSKLATTLIEALTIYLDRGRGYVLAVICDAVDNNNKPSFYIAANKDIEEITYYLSDDGKKYSVLPISNTEKYVNDINPLI